MFSTAVLRPARRARSENPTRDSINTPADHSFRGYSTHHFFASADRLGSTTVISRVLGSNAVTSMSNVFRSALGRSSIHSTPAVLVPHTDPAAAVPRAQGRGAGTWAEYTPRQETPSSAGAAHQGKRI